MTKSSSKSTASERNRVKTMNRADLTRRLARKLLKDEAVIGGIGNANFDLWASGQRPQNFYMLASMGLAVPIALGVAVAQPKRRTIVLEGDGSILMQLSSLGTVAALRQKNLVVIIFDNGVFQLTGSQRTLTSFETDVVAIAKGTGIAQSYWATDEAHFETLMDRALNEDGPWFVAACIDGKPAEGVTERDAIKIRAKFMQGMGVAE
jgi:thiamine pyrophosphate-dependent acetolactate synthase large subunit-like protein